MIIEVSQNKSPDHQLTTLCWSQRDVIQFLSNRTKRSRQFLHAACFLQVNHASDVWVLGKDEPESYDAMLTNQTGVVLAAPGADCMPILFADPVSKVIGVAHAGRCFLRLFLEHLKHP